ncbi:MAG: hypothetical protein V1897_00580 [Pseudomonadota bacterium]
MQIMLAIFTIPKPFKDHVGIIQRNALRSWLDLSPSCEVILCGDDEGVAETAAQFNVLHISNLERNTYGTPLLNSAFLNVIQYTRNNLLCYVNADIILFPNLLDAVKLVPFEQFLMVGQRWDMDVSSEIDFQSENWESKLMNDRQSRGRLHGTSGIDYFVFPKNTISGLPNFAVGRPGWDNWLIYHARSLEIPVIDATNAVKIIHQNHDYSHVKERRGNTYEGPEGDHNIGLMGGLERAYTISDATWMLTKNKLKPARSPRYLCRRIFRWLAPYLGLYRLLAKIKHLKG